VTGDENTPPEAENARPSVDEAGVDLGLIRAYLALSPIERLRSLQNAVRAIQKFRKINPRIVE
jgi:hypothetical protein